MSDRLNDFLNSDAILHVAPDGQMRDSAAPPRALFPGSFNPLHAAHWELACVAEQILGISVAFEMSVVNVDKPRLTEVDVRRRLSQFAWRGSIWLTHAATFAAKAEHFPGVTFVVGADTAMRLVSPRYYGSDAAMRAALANLRERDCRFLVACRVGADGECQTLDDVPIPAEAQSLFQHISPARFRWDLTSTQLRRQGRGL